MTQNDVRAMEVVAKVRLDEEQNAWADDEFNNITKCFHFTCVRMYVYGVSIGSSNKLRLEDNLILYY